MAEVRSLEARSSLAVPLPGCILLPRSHGKINAWLLSVPCIIWRRIIRLLSTLDGWRHFDSRYEVHTCTKYISKWSHIESLYVLLLFVKESVDFRRPARKRKHKCQGEEWEYPPELAITRWRDSLWTSEKVSDGFNNTAKLASRHPAFGSPWQRLDFLSGIR